MKRLFPSLIAASLLVVTSGCEKECVVPPGAYQMSLKEISGDCPADVVAQFEQFKDSVDVEPERRCKRFVTQVDTEIPESECTLVMDISANANEMGLDEGQAVLELSCGTAMSCRHTFQVGFVQTQGKQASDK